MPSGAEHIAAERQRQMDVEGWTPEHDAEHDDRGLAWAAACYVGAALDADSSWCMAAFPPPDKWPWDPSWWKPSDDPIRNLEKAGALIAAEIDRLQAARTPVPDWKVCGPCSLNVHDDCRRHDGAPCSCEGTASCGAALRVFTAAPIDGSGATDA